LLREGDVSQLAHAFVADLDDAALDELAALLAPRLNAQPKIEPWMTVDDAATYLGCERQRIYNLVSQRRLRHSKDGSRTLFRRQWLDDYMAGEV
jgi:excisionase family DNA binding protein